MRPTYGIVERLARNRVPRYRGLSLVRDTHRHDLPDPRPERIELANYILDTGLHREEDLLRILLHPSFPRANLLYVDLMRRDLRDVIRVKHLQDSR